MKIRITGCMNVSYWYDQLIGKEFDVVSESLEVSPCFKVKYGHADRFIAFPDAEVIEGKMSPEFEAAGKRSVENWKKKFRK